MSIFCENGRFVPNGNCPDGAYYRNLYRVDKCGRALPRTTPLIADEEETPEGYVPVSAYGYSLVKQTVASGDIFSLDLSGATVNASVATGGITLDAGGNFYASFIIYCDNGGTVSLALDGTAIDGATFTSDTGNVMGSAVFFSGKGGVLSIINKGAAITTPAPTLNAVTVSLSVTKLK